MNKNKNANNLILAGIGNPKEELSLTYHNIGILFIEYLKASKKWIKKQNFTYQKSGDIILVKSNEYMNNSGEAIKNALNFFKIESKNLILAHDDADILFGKYKIQFARGAAGHHGVESCIKILKTKNFWRIRIGIQNKNQKIKAENIVLQKIEESHLQEIKDIFGKIKNDIEKLFKTKV